jgi:DNA-binding NarL/FixJ family response regulator
MEEAMTRKARLLVADDQVAIRQQITDLLEQEFEVVGVARDGIDLLKRAQALKPDVIVTDFQMQRSPAREGGVLNPMNGIEAGRELIRGGFCGALVLLTMYEEPYLIDQALSAGFRGFVLKANAGEDLIPAVREALAGRTFVSEMVGAIPPRR